MPNWCENEVTFSGDEEKVQKIRDFVKGKERDFCFEEIVPMPKEIKDTTAPSNLSPEDSKKLKDLYGFDNWYDWCNENWDTKWNACEVDILLASADSPTSFCPSTAASESVLICSAISFNLVNWLS